MSDRLQNNSNRDPNTSLTKKDLRKIFFRSFFIRSALNFERQQNLGFANAMSPVIEKYYKDDEKRIEAYQRHMQLFLTNPMMAATIIGVSSAMEERLAVEKDIEGDTINAVKTAMMSPFAALGDSLISGTLRPLVAGIASSLALQGSILGPILFFTIMAVVSIGLKYWGVFRGYRKGVDLVQEMQESGLINRLSEVASVAALFVIGGFIPAVISLTTPISFTSGETVISIQEQLDALIPGILPLGITLLMYFLVKKTKISAVTLIVLLMLIGIVGVYLGIF